MDQAEEELKRIKAQVIAQQVYQRDSMFYQAMQMGVLDNAGLPPDSAALQVERVRAVTADQVRAVARRYLVDDGLTIAILEPQSLSGAVQAPAQPRN